MSIYSILTYLRRNCKRWILYIIICSFIFSFLWAHSQDGGRYGENYSSKEEIIQQVIRNVQRDPRYAEAYRLPHKLPAGTKYILLWTPYDYAPFYYLGKGQWEFLKYNCPMINCYVTTNKNFFGDDITKFDAILFNGRNILNVDRNYFPKKRKPNQLYIFMNMESSDNEPICQSFLDDFFNLTASYKLDSDILYNYFIIKTKDGKIIGPSNDIEWEKELGIVEEKSRRHLKNKRKAVAWFVSHCKTRSRREEYAKRLGEALAAVNLQLDVYGACGNITCPRDQHEECEKLLAKDYYFYLSFENSFAQDYVTEKLITALDNYVVPIVYGGADYTKFLPPGSYLDATKHTPLSLAKLISKIIEYPDIYSSFFAWRNHYIYVEPNHVCALCSVLNNETFNRNQKYKYFRKWWNPNYEKLCD